jgi:hypothetical protein
MIQINVIFAVKRLSTNQNILVQKVCNYGKLNQLHYFGFAQRNEKGLLIFLHKIISVHR